MAKMPDIEKLKGEFLVDAERWKKILLAAKDKCPKQVQPYVDKAAPILAYVFVAILWLVPYIVKAIEFVADLISKVPENILYGALGFLVCFFGGVFPATIAAVEAWELYGGRQAVDDVKVIYQELGKAKKASDEDDKTLSKDESGKQLLEHKLHIVLTEVDPGKIYSAAGDLAAGWVGVIATLKVKFARVISLGAVVGKLLYEKGLIHIEPLVKKVVPEEYHKWVSVVLQMICKAWAIHICWFVQRFVEAIHSATRGGHMFGAFVNQLLKDKGIKLPFSDHVVDIGVTWGLAAFGLLFQFSRMFSLPFPLNILLWPIQIIEGIVVWSIMS